MPAPDDAAISSPVHQAVVDALAGGGAFFFRRLADVAESTDDQTLVAALWDLVWSGHVSNDTLAPLRTLVAGGGAHKARRRATAGGRYGRGRPGACPAAPARRRPQVAGRCCPRSRPTPPGGRSRWPRSCSTGTAW